MWKVCRGQWINQVLRGFDRMKITHLRQTCFACPSQWEAILEDDSELYIRYRWGNFSVYKNDKLVYHDSIGDNLDGVMDQDQMLELLFSIGYELE